MWSNKSLTILDIYWNNLYNFFCKKVGPGNGSVSARAKQIRIRILNTSFLAIVC